MRKGGKNKNKVTLGKEWTAEVVHPDDWDLRHWVIKRANTDEYELGDDGPREFATLDDVRRYLGLA